MDERSNWARAHGSVLQEQNDRQEFKALSPGIGLGPKKAPSAGHRQSVPRTQSAQVRAPRPAAPASPNTKDQGVLSRPAPTAAPIAASWGMRLQAYVVDFFLVVTTLAVAFAGVTVYFATGENGVRDVWQQRPVQLLAHTSPFVTLGAVYAVYLVYTLFFKLLVGSTCGESLLGISTKIDPTIPMAKQKNF